MPRIWTNERVLAEIQARFDSGRPMRRVYRDAPRLLAAAKRRYGTWRRALRAAGLETQATFRCRVWSRDAIVAALRERCRAGLPLRNVQRTGDTKLEQAARRHFGSWHAALAAAGLAPTPEWTRDSALEAIRRDYGDGAPLRHRTPAERRLYTFVCREFGGWEAAMAAAGRRPCRRRWTRDRVLDELHGAGRAVLRKGFRNEHSALQSAATRHFGDWRTALESAGILAPPARRPAVRWNRQKVIDTLLARHRAGHDLRQFWQDLSLARAARTHWGGRRHALVAAGLADEPPPRWTRARLIAELQRRQALGSPVRPRGRDDARLRRFARREFGSWNDALRAAGIDVPPSPNWTRERLVAAIRAWQRQGRPLNRIWSEHPALFSAATKRFGNWARALEAAGFTPRSRRRWTKEAVLRELRTRYRRSLPSLQACDSGLDSAVRRLFGRIEAALEQAGIDPIRRRWSRARVIERIQDRRVRDLPIGHPADVPKSLARAAVRHFADWRSALAAAGLEAQARDEPRVRRRWSPEAVVAAIQERRRQGLSLTAAHHEVQALRQQARFHFGGWRNAVRAAGFEPANRQWTRAAVIAGIQERQRRGLPLNSAVWKDDGRLASAGMRLFGGWQAALAAAAGAAPCPTPSPDHRTSRSRKARCRAKR